MQRRWIPYVCLSIVSAVLPFSCSSDSETDLLTNAAALLANPTAKLTQENVNDALSEVTQKMLRVQLILDLTDPIYEIFDRATQGSKCFDFETAEITHYVATADIPCMYENYTTELTFYAPRYDVEVAGCSGKGQVQFDATYVEDSSVSDGHRFISGRAVFTDVGQTGCKDSANDYSCSAVSSGGETYLCLQELSCTYGPTIDVANYIREYAGTSSAIVAEWVDGIVITKKVIDASCATLCVEAKDAEGAASVTCAVAQKEADCRDWYDVREVTGCVITRNGTCPS